MFLEDLIADLNKNIFWKEFSFSKNQFKPTPKAQIEFADHVIWLEDLLFLFQIKERNTSDTSPSKEEKWFKNKVLKKAKNQITNTLSYLEEHDQIKLTNERGHQFNLSDTSFNQIFKIIVYAPDKKLPEWYWRQKFYRSSKSGFIHLFPVEKYVFILQVLVSLREIAEYLYFRERILTEETDVSERALLGQFISENQISPPSEEFSKHITQLDLDDDFNLSEFFLNYAENIEYNIGSQKETDYYKILAEFAKLPRSGLRAAKERLKICYNKVRINEFALPYRFYFPDTQCGFVFIPVEKKFIDKRITALTNYTYAAKYEKRMEKQVGVSIAKDGEYFLIDWIYIESPWQKDKILEKKLKDNYPFREVSARMANSFKFKK